MKHFEEWIRKQRHRDINETEDTQRQPSTFSYNEFWPTMGGQVINRMWPTQIKMYILLYSHLIKLLKYPLHRCKNDLSIPIQSCMSSSMTPLPHTLSIPLITATSSVAQWKRIRLPMQETWVQSLSLEDPLEKMMAAHSNILAWKIPWTEKPGRLPSMGLQRVGHDWMCMHAL